LTPNDARALGSLDVAAGRPMRALAEAWECDPSYATWIVDRLENLGLAEQQADPNDRRVKLVALTAKGLRTRTQVLDEFHRPPPEIAALEREDLEALDRILSKLAR
jgi:DNA-binding MarR family transcriptional regulator